MSKLPCVCNISLMLTSTTMHALFIHFSIKVKILTSVISCHVTMPALYDISCIHIYIAIVKAY